MVTAFCMGNWLKIIDWTGELDSLYTHQLRRTLSFFYIYFPIALCSAVDRYIDTSNWPSDLDPYNIYIIIVSCTIHLFKN